MSIFVKSHSETITSLNTATAQITSDIMQMGSKPNQTK